MPAATNSNRVLPWATLAMLLAAFVGSCVLDQDAPGKVGAAPPPGAAAPPSLASPGEPS